MDRKCRVAMVGAGGMAREHLKAFADLCNVDLVGITSRTRSKAEALAKEFGVTAVSDNVEELSTLKPDLVVLTVSADQMQSVVKECCTYPWTILAEKPVGLNLEQSRATLEHATKCGAKVYVALNRRLYQSTLKMKERLAELRGPRLIEVFDQQEPERWRQSGRDADETGIMFGNSIHTIDYLTHLGRGDIVSVERPVRWRDEVPLAVCAVIKFSSGDVGIYHGIWNAPGPWAVNVTTPEERWELRPLEKAAYQKMGERKLQEISLGAMDQKFKPGLFVQAQEAIKATRGERCALTDLAEANKTMELIHRIYH